MHFKTLTAFITSLVILNSSCGGDDSPGGPADASLGGAGTGGSGASAAFGGTGGTGGGATGGAGVGGAATGGTGGNGGTGGGAAGASSDAGSDAAGPTCSDAGASDAQNPTLAWSGSVVGSNLPSSAKVIVVWSVSSGSPDYIYYWGDGQLTGSTYSLSFTSAPPAAAINSYGVGIGLVLLVDSGFNEPPGKISDTALMPHILASNFSQAVIWRDASLAGLSWSGAFPDGYGFGDCCPLPGVFDGFVPIDPSASSLYLKGTPGQPQACNWT